MDKLTLRKEVQKMVGEAETEKALNLLLSFLGKDPAYLNLYNTILQAKSQFNRTERDESEGVLSVDAAKLSYNQVNRQILETLQRLNQEETIAYKASNNSNNRQLQRNMLWGIALLAILGIIGVTLYRTGTFGSSNGGPDFPPDGPSPGIACPDFPLDSNLNVLVLPFKDLNPDSETGLNIKIARLIETRLDEFKNTYDTNFDIAVKEDLVLEDFPNQMAEAESIAKDCDAELVIWGTAETTQDQRDIIITRYKFLNAEHLELHKLVLTSDTDIDTITTQSSIVTNGELTEGIEQTLQYIFGIIAHESGNPAAVIASLRELELKDTLAAFTKTVLLTDAYIVKDSTQQALEKTKVLTEIHPQYPLAQHNKGVMAFQQKNYDESYQRLVIAEELSAAKKDSSDHSKNIALNKANEPSNFPAPPRAEEKEEEIVPRPKSGNKATRDRPAPNKPLLEDTRTDSWKEMLSTEEGVIRLLRENPKDAYLWKRLTTIAKNNAGDGFTKRFEELVLLAKELNAEEVLYETPLGQFWKIRQQLPI